ncbi:MAG TPA: DUF2207 domain-containing protein [Galbitalea sp.]|jgi:uncharacterized membrane protein YgcG|nr:DUF2207 domain-containing protein [Galbitalea sp.]
MRKRIALLAATAAALLLILTGCSAGQFSNDPEHIDSFGIDYTVAKSGVVHVVETIKYDFGSTPDRHGIQRFLDSHFADTASHDRVYQYTNLHVSSPTGASALFSTARQEDLLIQVGNQNATLGGKQTYILSYDVHGALNQTKTSGGTALDEFYWNATGTEWTVPIYKTTITVHGQGDATAVDCVAGPPGSSNPCLTANKTDNGATFTQGKLGINQGVTIDIGWAAGTYTNTKPILAPVMSADAPESLSGSNDGPDPFWTPWNWGGGILILVVIFLGYFLFVRIRRRDQEYSGEAPGTIPTDPNSPVGPAPLHETIVPFYDPPAGFPVGAVSLIMDKQQSKTDVTVTLLDLAARGHLRIEEVAGGDRGKASDYNLIATPEKATVGDTAALLPHEQLLLHDLFAGSNTQVTLSNLKYSFYSEYTAVEVAISAWVQGKTFFLDKLTRSHPVLRWIVVASILVGGAMLFFDKAWIFWPLGAFIGAVLSLRQGRRAIRRSALGHATLIQLEGFKLYIATAEANQIHFEEGIDVFSRYLPWATAFGEADHWTGVFSQLAKEGKYTTTPDWYVGDMHAATAAGLAGSLVAISSLGTAVSNFSSFASESMSASPATTGSSGGSGFGGGDFGGGGGDVGGGGGGGGGGSW